MYEVCCTGTPALAVCQPIDHQLELSNRLAAAGAMATAGWGPDATGQRIAEEVLALAAAPQRRRQMTQIGPTLLNGRGASRVASILREAAGVKAEAERGQDFEVLSRN